jgi:hypothetical protein
MADYPALEAWFNETMLVYFVGETVVEGRLMGADQTGLEFEFIGFVEQTDEGLRRKERESEDPSYMFVPWKQIKFLLRS